MAVVAKLGIDVWQIGQNMSGNEFYDKAKILDGVFLGKSEILAAKRMANVCDMMSQTYDQIIEDQNEYLFEIDETYNNLENSKAELEKQIEALRKEIQELAQKKADGTITKEEEAELASKNAELDSLQSQLTETVDTKTDEINATVNKAEEDGHKSKKTIATDYGQTALEKGEPLSKTQDKRKSFWRKTFGGWNQQAKRDAGKKLLEVGGNLLEKVGISSDIDNQIANKTKKSV